MQSGHAKELISCCACSYSALQNYAREPLHYKRRLLGYGIAQDIRIRIIRTILLASEASLPNAQIFSVIYLYILYILYIYIYIQIKLKILQIENGRIHLYIQSTTVFCDIYILYYYI